MILAFASASLRLRDGEFGLRTIFLFGGVLLASFFSSDIAINLRETYYSHRSRQRKLKVRDSGIKMSRLREISVDAGPKGEYIAYVSSEKPCQLLEQPTGQLKINAIAHADFQHRHCEPSPQQTQEAHNDRHNSTLRTSNQSVTDRSDFQTHTQRQHLDRSVASGPR